ncbi:gamma-glutamyltransferase [Roseomonas marmotae]|uniref:Glutathione hydrolase proenzyme n=1 Tax=Roseomonas marmotae TaxID=2768161 RepID=A0ABS3KGX4_9PROT|nr:gamma-glutamyltransferase [Roseomonas marmotae]MBO1076720.1 gamma-glutamyltransferase [Roseomonas marmotae]QTI77965.1 gamma-glutamyltransferase [Roseomonas marmotae]
MRDFHAPGRSPVLATRGMAATSMPAATLAAIDILRNGGNALDAAIAAAAVLAVVEPQSTGIGGDCFCLYAPAGQGRVVAMNGSGRAPAGATPERLRADGLTAMDPTSPHSVTVPGAVSAWGKLNAVYGRMPLDRILAPAIRLAEEGHPIHPRVASDWQNATPKLSRREATARHFLKDGQPLKVGDIFRQPALARTLRAIANEGARAFYEGEIAADMVATLRAAGGSHTEADFAAGLDVAEFVEPIQARWKGLDIFQCPPNGSGMLVLSMLGVLERFETPEGGPLSATRLHRHTEVARLAYRDRDAFLADPSQVEVPVAKLTSAEYTAGLRALISDEKAMRELPPAGLAEMLPVHKDTVYLCVVDADGNVCSFINSLFESFGSGILAEKSGVMLHNRGFGFRLQEGHPNCIAPNKRPMHTIIPGMVMKDGQPLMPYGVMGGHFQPMGQTLFLSNHFEFGLDVQAALDLPRLFPYGGKLQVERGIPSSVVDQLSRMGHVPELIANPHGGGQAILIDRERGVLIGGSDPRKDGCALGY